MFECISTTVRYAVLLVLGLLGLSLLSAWGGGGARATPRRTSASSLVLPGGSSVTDQIVRDALRAGNLAETTRDPVVRLQQSVRGLALLEAADKTVGRESVERCSGSSFQDLVATAQQLRSDALRRLGSPYLR